MKKPDTSVERKQGILLINLGTPAAAEPKAVYQYLKEFLNDPYVIDLPALIRWPLINLVIIPFRYKNSTHLYQKIWTKAGSPLLLNHLALQTALSEMCHEVQVEVAMRYGKPSISTALSKLKDVDELTVVPLFPQYSHAATGSVINVIEGELRKQANQKVKVIKDFYQHDDYISAYSENIRSVIAQNPIDMLMFSYHGLPERQIKKTCQSDCDRIKPCPLVNDKNENCYRAQCFATARLIAEKLALKEKDYVVAFQSRLGRTPWIKPYTDLILHELYAKGVRKLGVVCPSFVSDCLETLEEINIRLRKQWLELGGTTFVFIPSLNVAPHWVKALANIAGQEKLR